MCCKILGIFKQVKHFFSGHFYENIVNVNYFCHWLQMLKHFRASFLCRFWCNLKKNFRRSIWKVEISQRYRILSSSLFVSLQLQWCVARFWVSLSNSNIFLGHFNENIVTLNHFCHWLHLQKHFRAFCYVDFDAVWKRILGEVYGKRKSVKDIEFLQFLFLPHYIDSDMSQDSGYF